MILGVTPARGGSKGIPKKNIKEIAGKPLLAWTIEAAKSSRLLDRYIVSTEDEEIADVARRYGAEVLYRPPALSADDILTIDVLKHAVESIPCETVVLMQATTPVRRPGLVDECIQEFIDNGYDSLATGFICKEMEYGKDIPRRQDIKGFFCGDGNIYVYKADLLKKRDRYGKKMGTKIISRWENIDIDDEFDFWVAEKVLSERTII